MTASIKTTPRTVDNFIAAALKDKQATLKKLRETIKRAAPKASENRVTKAYAAELKNHLKTKGTTQFPADEPLP